MTILLNSCFGQFSVPIDILQKWDDEGDEKAFCCGDTGFREVRTSQELIDYLKTEEGQIWNRTNQVPTEIMPVDIPDNITDWKVLSAAGYEILIYVIDGKLHFTTGHPEEEGSLLSLET